jgi:hypothetical protein
MGRIPKWMRPYIKAAEEKGYVLSGGGKRHYKLSIPGESPVIFSASASDHRTERNIRAILRRRGVDV